MRPKAIEIVSQQPDEEVSFFLIPTPTLEALTERAAKKNMTVAQLLKKAIELALE